MQKIPCLETVSRVPFFNNACAYKVIPLYTTFGKDSVFQAILNGGLATLPMRTDVSVGLSG